MSNIIFISLGSNLGDRLSNLEKSKKMLQADENIKIIKESSVLETEPVDFWDQPFFFNQTIQISSSYEPVELLKRLKEIEKKMGREKTINKGPRIIDLDILFYNNFSFDSSELKIPHPQILNRNFFVDQLLELDSEIFYPPLNKKLREVVLNEYNS